MVAILAWPGAPDCEVSYTNSFFIEFLRLQGLTGPGWADELKYDGYRLIQRRCTNAFKGNEAIPKDTDITKRIIPLFVIVMIAVVLVISMLW